MRRLGLRAAMTTALAAMVMLLAGAGGAFAATTTSVWPAAAAVGLPSGASGTQSSTSLPSVSCGSSAQCVAVGGYTAASGTEPMVETATNGGWSGTAATIAPPSGASTASLSSVSCSAAGTCVAVGSDVNSGTNPIVASEASGAWGGASELALPSGASAGVLSGISCLAGNNCSAVGSATFGGSSQAVAVTAAGGSFGSPPAWQQITLTAGATSGALSSVACTSPGNCVAAGSEVDSGGQTVPIVATETAGAWGPAGQIILPAGSDPTQGAGLNAISCPASGQCTAVGSYLNGSGQTAAMVVSESGTWGQAAALGLPAGTSGSTLDSISCTNGSSCTATGSVVTGAVAPMAATESGGSWAAGTALPTPSGAVASGSLTAIALAVGCTGAQQCEAAGTYPVAAGIGAMALDSHPSLAITSRSLPAGAIGSHYTAHIATAGGTGGDVWAITGGSLPAGLSFNTSTGSITGTPTTDQTTTFSVSVHDNATPPDQASATLSITIGPRTKPAKTTTSKGSTGKGSGKNKKKKTKGAVITGVKVLHGSQAHFTLRCVDQRHCDGRVAIVIVEHFKGKKLIAINALTHRARGTRTKTVWIGSMRYALRDGRKVVRTIRLDRTGARLLKAHKKFKAGLALRPSSFRRANIVHTLKLHVVKPKKHKHAKGKHDKGKHAGHTKKHGSKKHG